ncbi:hypothetical protein JCM11641_000238 [Rhodosporidiobolus odoratus]
MDNYPSHPSYTSPSFPYPYSTPSQHVPPVSAPYRHFQHHPAPPFFPPYSRVAAALPPLNLPRMITEPYTSIATDQANAQHPLIPKRRRRTTPAEFAILETEFRLNPRPTPIQRGLLADRLGMTFRAVQVWYQNRRQKEKKDAPAGTSESSTASSVTSSGSDPKDLDGVVLSFSSSPLPSPGLPLLSPGLPTESSQGDENVNSLHARPLVTASTWNLNKGTTIPLSRPAPQPLQPTFQFNSYHYSYPSGASASQNASAAPSAGLPASQPSYSAPSVYLHRPHDASIITAKKHTRKRPLGSNALIARTPSLTHAFNFPPSPPKPTAKVRDAQLPRPPVTRRVSLNEVIGRQEDKAGAAVGGLFACPQGETMAKRRRSSAAVVARKDSSEPEVGNRSSSVFAARQASLAGPSFYSSATTAAKSKEDLLHHMQSDPPSESSPQPLSRHRLHAHEAALSGRPTHLDDEQNVRPSFDLAPSAISGSQCPSLPGRSFSTASAPNSFSYPKPAAARTHSQSIFPSAPSSHPLTARSISLPLGRSVSLGPVSYATTSSASLDTALEHSASQARAPGTGGEMACALEALGRKRAQILDNGPAALTLPQAVSGGSRMQRTGVVENKGKGPSKKSAAAQKRRRSSVALSSITSLCTDIDERDRSAEMGDLSFSSTSTATSVDSLATAPDRAGGYFALGAAVAAMTAKGDDENECAELLLGLGGMY